MKWISVKKKLPPTGERVLGYFPTCWGETFCIVPGNIVIDGSMIKGNATHWQYITPPTKRKAKRGGR